MKLKLSISIVLAIILTLSFNVIGIRSQGLDPNCTVTGYTAPYDGNPHTADGSCTGTGTLNLSATTHTNVGDYTDTWTFHDSSGTYADASGQVSSSITRIDPGCSVSGYNVTYDGLPHTADGSCTGTGSLDLTSTTHTDLGTYTDGWSFTGTGNYADANGSVTSNIGHPDPTCTIVGWSGTYDGQPHAATGSCKGTDGTDLGGLNLGASYIDAPGGNANWSFTDSTGFYNSAGGSVSITIYSTTANCSVHGWSGDYDTLPHGASGSCTGIGGEDISSGLDFGLPFTDVPGGNASWTLTNPNYNSTGGTVAITINKVAPNCYITSYSGTYDGQPHGLSGQCFGIGGVPLSGLDLGESKTNVGFYTVTTTFSGDSNYKNDIGGGTIAIAPAGSTVTVNCPGSVPYTGTAQKPCSATATGPGMSPVDVSGSLVYHDNTDAGAATADASWAGDSNNGGSNGSGGFTITPAPSTVTVNCPASVPYTGSAQTPCTAAATGVNMSPVDVTASLVYHNNTDVGSATADASWDGDPNHAASDPATGGFTISPAAAACAIVGFTGPYDGAAHGASGSCTGIGGATLAGLNLGATFTDVPGGTANWTLTNPNYTSPGGSVPIVINKTTVTCNVIGFSGVYDGLTHGASGQCTTPAGLIFSGPPSLNFGLTRVNVGSTTTVWSFSNPNISNAPGNQVVITITPASADCSSITGYSGVYDALAHGASGTCRDKGAALSGLNLGSKFTDVPGGTANWTFTNTNYNSQSGSVPITITKAAADCTSIVGWTGIYDGLAHGASGACTGVGGATLSGLNLGATFTNVPGGTANWAFTNMDYADQSGSVAININQLTATCTISPDYTVIYDGTAYGATGSCVDANNNPLSGLVLGATFVNVPGGTANWTFTNPNVSNSPQGGSVVITIKPLNATCAPSEGYSVVYDKLAHGIKPFSCTDSNGNSLSGLNLGVTFTDVPGGTATWILDNPNTQKPTGVVNIAITLAPSTVKVTCPPRVTYTGSPQTPCTAEATGVGGLKQTLTVTYVNNVNVGTATASASFAGDTNHSSSGPVTKNFTISNPGPAKCDVKGYNLVYDGNAHTPSYKCTDPDGQPLTGTLTIAAHTDAGTYPDSWTFDDDSGTYHVTSTKPVNDKITQAEPGCSITPVNVPYDGQPHTATGYCTGVNGEILGIDLHWTTHTAVGTYRDPFFLNDTTHNYKTPQSNYINGVIGGGQYDVVCSVTGYRVPFDGTSHTASGTCTGPGGINLTQYLDLGGTAHTNPGNYKDTWSFNPPAGSPYHEVVGSDYWEEEWYDEFGGHHMREYFRYHELRDRIMGGTVNCSITDYTGTYDGAAHTPGGSCTVGGTIVPGLEFSPASYTDAPGGTVAWTFTNANASTESGTASVNITPAASAVTVNCPASVPYTGSAQTPCSAAVTGAGLNKPLTVTYSNNTSSGTASASASYPGDLNHTGSSGSGSFEIKNAAATCSIGGDYTVIYDGSPHGASGSCFGTGGVPLSGLSLGLTFINVPGGTAGWSFSNPGYSPQSGSVNITITPAPAAVAVDCPASVPYTGSAQAPCTAQATGVGMPTLDLTSSIVYGNNKDVGTASAQVSWAGDANHTGGDATKSFAIGLVPSLVTVTCPASVPYTGSAQTPCTAAVTGAGGLNQPLLVTYTNNTAVGTATASASFAGDANHDKSTGSATFTIDPALSTVTVTCPASVPYTGLPQTPCTASVTGAGGLDQTLPVTYTDNTNIGTATASASFAGDATHSASQGQKIFDIGISPSTVTVTCPASVPYTGTAQTPCTAQATAVGMTPVDLTSSIVYSSNTNIGTATAKASWAGDANYSGNEGTDSFEIGLAPSIVTVTCPASVPYTGSAQTPCTASVTGADGLNQSLTVTYGNNTNSGTATASASYAGDATHSGDSKSATFVIGKADAVISVHGYTGAYDGQPHGASGTAVGMNGEDLSGLLHLGGTFTAVPGGTAHWTFDGNLTYNAASGDVDIVITKIDAACTVTGYTAAYNGSAQTAAGSCTALNGGILSGLNLGGTSHVNVGDYPGDTWTFTDLTGNYNNASGTVHDKITGRDATCTITPYNAPYDGRPHTATGYCIGVNGASLTGLDLSGTAHTNAGDYPLDAWTFTDPGGNYNPLNGTVHDSITRANVANAVCTITGYTVTYDGSAHTATGSCVGLNGETLAGLDLGATLHTDAGNYAGDIWTFTDVTGNYYSTSGTVDNSIARVDAVCTIKGYTGVYDGANHGATGSCTGPGGVTLAGLDLGQSFDHVPGGTANWSFSNPNVSNSPQNGSVNITITPASSTVTVACPASVPYTGSPLTPCSAVVTGAGGLDQSLPVTYTGNTDLGLALANSSWSGDANHDGSSGFKTFTIISVVATVPGDKGLAGGAIPLVPVIPSTETPDHKTDRAAGSDLKAVVLSIGTQGSSTLPTLTPTGEAAGDQKAALATAAAAGSDKATAEAAAGQAAKSSGFLSKYSGLLGWLGAIFLFLLVFFMPRRRKKDDEQENAGEASAAVPTDAPADAPTDGPTDTP